MALNYATPPRPSPGGYVNTPAPRNAPPAPSFNSTPGPRSQSLVQTGGQQVNPASQPALRPAENLTAAERAARAINDSLDQVLRTYGLEQEYQARLAYNYDMRTSSVWAPFQKVRSYTIPDQIFEQLNRAQVSTNMGLFAELHHAWVTVDNALYVWDYTMNNPELLGFEDQPSTIETVKLAKPRPGVFLENIKHMIVLASANEIIIVGLGTDPNQPDAGLTLFQTGMTASIKGLQVDNITCSAKTGRVFFGSNTDNSVRELKYQAQDSWFAPRCSVINHTRNAYETFTGALTLFSKGSSEYVKQMDMDDSRNLLYTLSSNSSIRAFQVPPDGGAIDQRVEISMQAIHRSVAYELQNGPISDRTKIVTISAMSEQEASAWVLMATTLEGYRIYLGGAFAYGSKHLTGLTPVHTRTPPLLAWNAGEAAPTALNQPNNYLNHVQTAKRFAPGYFFAAIARTEGAPQENLFVSVPDLQADTSYQRPNQGMAESASWIELNSQAMDIGFTVPYIGPSSHPQGFRYEVAMQFDEPIPEVAILTNTGVHVLRRKRFIDSLCGLIRQGGGQEGLQNEVKNLIMRYGRQEVLADALAVACGQSVETTSDRSIRINDPEVLDAARKIFIEHGGRPMIDQNAATGTAAAIDAVRPSPRYEAAVRYVSRLIRSTWKQPVARQVQSTNGYQILSAVQSEKLLAVQENLTSLQKFFNANRSFISGLSGPDDLTRQTSKEDELANQGEHRALHSLVRFISEMTEAISFVSVLFEEQVVEIVPLLPEQSRKVFMSLTFEQLVATKPGMEVAKDLVKAIVNRNIAKGSNVETIAEALRRKCGSFCSSDDVIIFKAQEQLKRAAEAKANAEYSRNLLNESLKLFEQVSQSLPHDYLQSAVNEYVELQFFAGAIQLALKVAYEHDKTNDALAWMNDGRSENDPRREKWQDRNRCYDLIHDVLEAIDRTLQSNPPFVDGRPSLSAVRRDEAYDVISRAKDEVFLTNLYDWYLTKNWYDRLLATDSGFIITYLTRKSHEDITYADLLWKYYGNNSQFHDAAKVQHNLAQSAFPLSLDKRLEYLSRARANASAFTAATASNTTTTRKAKQKLLTEINGLIDVANIQSEILQRLRDDPRLTSQNRERVLADLDGPIQPISDLFNKYADSAGYYDVCLYIYAIADHRDGSQIKNTWAQFLEATHAQALQDEKDSNLDASVYEIVASRFREVGGRLKDSEAVFPVPVLIDMLERYNINQNQGVQRAPGEELPHWIPTLFIELEVSYELLYDTLETVYFTSNTPGSNIMSRRILLSDLLFVLERWLQSSYTRAGQTLFGGDQGQARVEELLLYLTEQQTARQIGEPEWQSARALRARVESMIS